MHAQNNLPGWLIITFFGVNVGTVSAITYVVLLYFVRQKDLAMQLMRKNRELEQSYLQQEIMLRQSEKLATIVVQKHKGEISARSEPGASWFQVRLRLDFEGLPATA